MRIECSRCGAPVPVERSRRLCCADCGARAQVSRALLKRLVRGGAAAREPLYAAAAGAARVNTLRQAAAAALTALALPVIYHAARAAELPPVPAQLGALVARR